MFREATQLLTIRTRPVTQLTSIAISLSILLISVSDLHGSSETPGPAFVDWKRGVEKQRNAAREARREITGGSADAARVFELLADDSGVVRDEVFDVVIKEWTGDDLLALAPGLLSSHQLVAESVAELFGRGRPDGGVELLKAAAKRQRSESARALVIWALSQYEGESAEAVLHDRLKGEKSWLVRAELLSALSRRDRVAVQPFLEKALREKKLIPLRLAALKTLYEVDPPAAFSAAVKQLSEPPRDKKKIWGPRLELAALEVLSLTPPASLERSVAATAVESCLASLEPAQGRARQARYDALENITGEVLPRELVSWRAWWATKKETWEPGVPSAGERSGGDGDEDGTAVVKFHGLEVETQRVTFLQDLSGGMSRSLSGDQGSGGPTRLDHAKDELDRVLNSLAGETWVNVITFASTYFAAHREPQLLSRARRSLIKFCRQQEIPTRPGHARGNVYDALAFAISSPYVDTVCLVSEGAPTEGKYHDYDRFLWHFQRLNRWYGTRVHVVLVGETGGRNRSFLEQLAGGTGGSIRSVSQSDSAGFKGTEELRSGSANGHGGE